MRILLMDDDPVALERLEARLRSLPDIEVVGKVVGGDLAAKLIPQLMRDLVFLDIRTPGRASLALARRGSQAAAQIAVMADFDDMETPDFEPDAVPTPAAANRADHSVVRTRRRRTAATRTPSADEDELARRYVSSLWVPRKEGLLRVDLTTIDWIEAAGDYVLLHTSTRSHMLRTTMGSLQVRLDPDIMVRVSRSAFIRADAVTAANRPARGRLVLTLAGRTAVTVGPTYRPKVAQAFGFLLRGLAAE